MLTITVPASEYYDENTQTFVYVKESSLILEHSLISISKWESNWNKAFLSDKPKTIDETIDYVKCMTITQNVNPVIYCNLSTSILEEINKYIEAPMTATYITESKTNGYNSRETITSELIYYWMIALNIPFECQKWHLNRLLMLIRVCNIKNSPSKKRSQKDIMSRNADLNKLRRDALKTKG